MRKLTIMVLLVAFVVGCTATDIEEDYDSQIEAVDLSKIHRPGDKDKDNENDCDSDSDNAGS